jgi:hypothetical protein
MDVLCFAVAFFENGLFSLLNSSNYTRREESETSLPTKGMRRPPFHLHHQTDCMVEVQSAVDARPVNDTTMMPEPRAAIRECRSTTTGWS